MKKNILLLGIVIAFIVGFSLLKRTATSDVTADYTIGILQTASHPALDASRDGFIEELKEKMGTSIVFVTQNAQGSISYIHAIAQQFHANKKYNAFFAIATPAAQAMSAIEKERPICISAVTDPESLGLLHATTNVCGTKDMIDVKAEIEMLVTLLPHLKTVGLIYTSGEINATTVAKQMRIELEAYGITPIDFAISNESDVHAAVELACRKTDAILTPIDNTVALAITSIAAITRKYKKPLIVSDNMLVQFGALAARGVDYKAGGKRAAQLLYDVLLNGEKPYNLPIEPVQSEHIFINQDTLDELGLTIPEALQKYVVLIS